uniref:DUF6063 family protein n=1 Tax=Alicyclobacillus tolerans TaxID=90970 RepID=UPI00235139A3|nr:DUF6063 family protein [Alicyclobacillus tolerans]
MSYTLEQMQQAADLFAKLWQNGEVDLEDETGLLYHEQAVREILEDVYERRWGVKILHAPESLILVPAVGDSLFGYTHAEGETRAQSPRTGFISRVLCDLDSVVLFL